MNILIVEDDDNKAQDIITFLIKEGVMSLSIKTVDNVNDALTLLREIKYDILLLDLSLPLRKSGHPIPDGGSKILYNLTSPYFLTPSHVIGLTQFSDLSDNERPKFQKFDFNIYDYNIDIWKDVLSQKLKWILKHTTSVAERAGHDKIIILTHGIMTSGKWQSQVTEIFKDTAKDIIPFRYPHYSAFKILLPQTRKKILDAYVDFVIKTCQEHPTAELNFISHSFGTYMTITALNNANFLFPPAINNIILCGSVLKQDYDISAFIDKTQTLKLINDCACDDKALIFSNMFCFGLGNAGRIGFNGYHEKLVNRFFKGGHSTFFSEKNNILRSWFNAIENSEVDLFDMRSTNIFAESIDSVMNLIAPLVKIIYIPVIILIFILYLQ